MKLIRARFENFRIIREMEINFSTEATKPLTVIRAANESGKTTLLMALQWALYGDAALPNNGKDYRLHPIDWKTDTEGTRCNISASVEFEVKKYHKVPGTGVQRETITRYRIVRTASEQVSGDTWNRASPSVSLFELTDTGDRKKEHPDSVINEELPPELREVFFTDGDRALSFIEANATQSVKRERVQRAIRSLLGLEVVQETLKHVKKTAADINKRAKAIGGSAELTHVTTRLAEIDDQLSTAEKDLESAKTQFIAFDDNLREVDKKIEETLKKGDREQLAKDLEASKKTMTRLDERIKGAVREHSNLFKSEALARDILAPLLSHTFKMLDVLRDQNKIPSTTIPVLEEQLKKDECVCGETLSEGDSEGRRRRIHICRLIDESRQADAVQGIVTSLYFGSKGLDPRNVQEGDRWMADYLKVAKNRDDLGQEREEAGRRYKGIEANIAAIPDTDIQTLKAVQGQYKDQRDRFNAKKATLETQINGLKDEAQDLTKQRERLLREQAKGGQILAELVVVKDIQDVLQRSYERITDIELKKVSNLMNTLFLEMIGADVDQGALITKAEISPEFDILVYGSGNRTLNPDRDLNGASRRALTLAFILALTKISEVEAPNVIDTPLGMTSGYVKRSILRTAIKNSTQLIMFLTHDEIAGTGEIIEQYSGMNMTVTNPAHYPRMLVNDPTNKDIRAIKCGCKHDVHCPICERRLDPETETALAKVS
jgi:DNA sulfur modification protein DndD